jgi:ABC-2 type transport system permease protein
MSGAQAIRTASTTAAEEAALHKALSSTPRPPRASALSAALTFGWRGMLKVKHVPEQLLDVTITPVMFVLLFTFLFGGAIAGRPANTSTTSFPGSSSCRCCSPPSTRASRSTPI